MLTNSERAYLAGHAWAATGLGYVDPHYVDALGRTVKARDMTESEKKEYHKGVREHEPD